MKLTITKIDLSLDLALVNYKDFSNYLKSPNDSVYLKIGNKGSTFLIKAITTGSIIAPGSIGFAEKIIQQKGLRENTVIEVSPHEPRSITGQKVIEEWINGRSMTKDDFANVVRAFMDDDISPHHASAFVLKQHFQTMNPDEIEAMAKSFADSGNYFEFEGPIFDKHSIGGVAGNKISLIIVPILAAAGLTIPKVSTHAITSASGTADTMGVLAPVDFTLSEVKEIVTKTKGCIVYSGEKMGIAPVVDKIISDAAFPLGLDPTSLFLAGILSKKIAMGVDFMVLDIPIGPETKVANEEIGRTIGRTFVELASRLGIKAEAGLTYGSVPVGHSIGPVLEAREALMALENKGPTSLVEKSCAIAGIVFEIAGVVSRGEGKAYAKEYLYSGKALTKMREILEAQGGDPNIKPEDLTEILNQKPYLSYQAPTDGWPVHWDNRILKEVARIAGAPKDPAAGIEIITKKESVRKGEEVFRVYAASERALDEVRAYMAKHRPVIIESVLLERVA